MDKDFQRGEGCNCEVMGEGNSPADHTHVSRTTPLMTKKREVEMIRSIKPMRSARAARSALPLSVETKTRSPYKEC